ncbi:nucleoside-diphosphate-sugar epimerase [Maribacter vaceletii]|uniref:Nucleoside-diphosphate-sugar epimerase n=1 Tax=Maribacter vaceletii TaxID=1206816 RepID=A0A495E8K3_9FLAO|nr:NAD-dependent epimerase/dehydratase family protein [Maribacter vaceletii]RKR13260.1 nucleoside-diphosphate-sugar epimerase [Maribacter vaceletii]
MKKDKILVTGAGGQLGTVLVKALQKHKGRASVIATDLYVKPEKERVLLSLDATNATAVEKIIEEYSITQIYHLAAILSAKGEEQPLQTWDINLKSLFTIFEAARKYKVNKVFFPSSIAVFGASAPKLNTPQDSCLDPTTVYGISKVAGEQWANYYYTKYGLDVRSLRYPGIIGHQSLPGGGTTDYAVDIYHKAVQREPFECYLKKDTALPMIFMEDAVRATLELMEAPKNQIKTRTSYNLNALSFTPEQVAKSIQKWYPNFKITYKEDYRESIAQSWPSSILDTQAQEDWHWEPHYRLDDISNEMLTELKKKYDLQSQL